MLKNIVQTARSNVLFYFQIARDDGGNPTKEEEKDINNCEQC